MKFVFKVLFLFLKTENLSNSKKYNPDLSGLKTTSYKLN
jgi:hypothetical protein